LVAFECLPVDVAFVMILQQDLAVSKRTIVPVGLARPAINDLGSVDGFAVSVGAGIEWVLQHRDDIAVAIGVQSNVVIRLPSDGRGKCTASALSAKMHLPGTARLMKALEDLAGDLLDAAIRIEVESDIPMPDITDRHGKS